MSTTIEEIKKVFGEDATRDRQIRLWQKRFKGGQESVENDTHSAKFLTIIRTTENVDRVWAPKNEIDG